MPQKLDLQQYGDITPQLDLQPYQSTYKEPAGLDWWIDKGLRTVPAVAGGIIGGIAGIPALGIGSVGGGMAGGAAGSALGNVLGNWYSGKEFNPTEFAVETALGAVPPIFGPAKYAGKGLGAIAKYAGKTALSGAAEGALVSAGGTPFQHYAQTGSFDAPLEEYLQNAASGGVMGSVVGGGIGAFHGHGLSKIGDVTAPPPPHEATPYAPPEAGWLPFGDVPQGRPPASVTPEITPDMQGGLPFEDPQQLGLPFGSYRGANGRFTNTGPPRQFPTRPFLEEPIQPQFDFGEPPPPSAPAAAAPPPPMSAASGVGIPPIQTPPITGEAPAGSSLSPNGQIVTISAPEAATVQYWRDKGFVPVQGLRSPEGHVQLVRGDIAPLYVTGERKLPTPAPVKRPEIPGPLPQDAIIGGEVVRVPNERASNAQFLEGMSENYVLAGKDATHTTFRRKTGEEGPAFSRAGNEPPMGPEDIRVRLREMLGREPTDQEIQLVIQAQQQTPQIGEGLPPIDMSQWPPNGPFVPPVNQGEGVQQAPGLEGMGPLPTQPKGNVVPGMQIPPEAGGLDVGRLRQMSLFPPEGPNPRTMDPRMMARVEAGGPREFDFTQAPNQQGQMELPWARGENPMPIDGDAAMRQQAYDAEQRRIAGQPQPMQGELFPDVGRNEPSFARSAPPPLSGGVFEAAVAHMNQETDINVLREYMDITTKALQYHRNSGDTQELSLYRKLREAVVDRLNTIASGEQPLMARAPSGGLTASVDIRRAVENITKDYTSPLPGIMSREGLQNALDAADALGSGGDVKIRMDVDNNTIEIYDNGKGLNEDQLSNKLVEIFATGKEGEAGATGGKGIGSASYIYGGQHFKIETVAIDPKDGIKYRIIAAGTPEQFLDPVKGSDWERVPVDPRTPTGTTIEVLLKGEHDLADAQAMVGNIVNNSRNRPSRIVVDEEGVSRGVPLRDVQPDGADVVEHRMPSSKGDKKVGDFTTTNRNSDVKVLVPKFDASIPRNEFEVHYLNNGMYQFSETMHLGDMAEGVPDRVLVDIHPLVDDQNELYPFINTREDIKRDIRTEVTDYIKKNIARPGIEKRKNRVQELYDSMSPVPVRGAQRKSIIYDPGERLTKAEMRVLTSSPVVQKLVQTYDKLVNDILVSTGRTKWIDRLEGVGLVLDPGMHGVHIPNPTTGKSTILINPFIRIADASLTPAESAWKNVGTNLHEVAHVGTEHGTPIQLTPQDLADPRLGQFLGDYMNELVRHGDVSMWSSTGHGMDFAHRLGEVYAKFGVDATFNAADEIHGILTGGRKSGGYSPEVQKLLQLYTESRGRAATTEDLLSGTGVKQADRGPDTAGNIPSDSEANGDGTTPWGRIKNATGWGMGATKGGKHDPKEFNFVKEALAVPSNATTTLDLSAPGRQGISMVLTPEFWSAAGKMFKGLHYDSFKQMDAELRNKPIMQRPIDPVTGKESKSFGEQIGTKIYTPASEPGPRAEATASRWLENIPLLGYPIRATNRAYLTFLNHLNVNRTEKLLNLARDMSIEALDTGSARPGIFRQKFTPQEAANLNPYHNLVLAKEIADFVNTATGHGPLRTHVLPFKQAEVSLEKAAGVLGHVLFSPGLLASRARMMNPSTYIMASPYVRKQYAKAALSTAAAWYVSTELMKKAAGPEAEVNNDITSADFGKVRLGDARLDLGGGFLQFAVAYGRAYMGGSTSSASNEFHRFGSGYQAQTQEDMMERFFVNKLNPVAKFAWDVASASEYNPFHVGDRTAQLFVPLFIQDLGEIYKENPDLLPMFGGAAMFGGGTQIYSKGESISKFVDPENDWNVTGGGARDLMPWNWSADPGEKRTFPWSEPSR